jgi:hypothetical protein
MQVLIHNTVETYCSPSTTPLTELLMRICAPPPPRSPARLDGISVQGQSLPWWDGQSWSALPQISDVNLLSDSQGIIHFDAEIPYRALDLSVAEKQLYGSQIPGSTIDQRSLGPSKGVGAEHVSVQADTSDPTRYKTSILPRCYCTVSASAAEHKTARLLPLAFRYSSTAWRVCSVSSNRTGWPVFLWRTGVGQIPQEDGDGRDPQGAFRFEDGQQSKR